MNRQNIRFGWESWFSLLILLLAVSNVSLADDAATDGKARYWEDQSGNFKILATLKNYDSASVTLVKQDSTAIHVPRSKLSTKDNRFILAIETLRQSAEQAELIAPHLNQVVAKPGATLEIIEALRNDFPEAIGANLYGAAIYANLDFGSDTLRRAKSCMGSAIKSLQCVETHFPGRHTKTLASALNNQAVLAIRDGNLNAAVTNLIKSAELLPDEVPFAVYHNASLILDSGADLGGSRIRLARILAHGKPEGTELVDNFLMYTLIHNPLNLVSNASATKKSPGKIGTNETVLLNSGNRLIGTGSGFLIAPDLVLTNRHVAEDAVHFRIKNDAGLSATATTLKLSTSDDIDLAVLKLSSPINQKPLPIRSHNARLGETLVVLGYPQPEFFEETLTVSRGVINKTVKEGLQLLHDASTDPGNSGGPCIDENGNVIGVHFAGSTIAKNARNYAVATNGIESFLSDVATYSKLPEQSVGGPFEDVLARMKAAVFLVEIYGTQTKSMVIQKPTSASAMEKYALIADRCCLGCGGSGVDDCPACIRGVVNEKRRVQVALNRVTGEPIVATKTFKKACTRCQRGFLRCSKCGGSGTKR
jgi:serine protease Do